jgi:Rrf2 family iron-sulfur cluster assembly transcriptional regulator
LFTQLRRHKLVRFTRGREGGYEPARRPDEITVAQVVQCVKEAPDRRSTFCAEGRVGDNAGKCLTQELWAGLDEVMHGVLDAVTIQDLINQAQHRDSVASPLSMDALPLRPLTLPRGVVPRGLPVARSEAPSRLLSESLA